MYSAKPRFKALVAAAALLLTTAPVLAGQYELVKGKGVEVCEAYHKYLVTQKTALTCDRGIPPEFSQFKKPEWKKLDPNENKLLVLRIENYLQIPRDEKATKPWSPIHREDALATYEPPTHARLYLADIDIDNDGKAETVAKYRSFMCQTWDDKAPHWRAPIVVLDVTKQSVDIEKTYSLMQNPMKVYVTNADEIANYFKTNRTQKNISKHRPKSIYKESKYAAGGSELQGYDIFLFKGTAYFDKWDEVRNGDAYQTLTVYQTISTDTKNICRYQFRW